MIIEICFSEVDEDYPEHYGYYSSFKDAKEALDELEGNYEHGKNNN